MKRELFAYLKDRKIFTGGGHKTLKEVLSENEERELMKHTSRKHIRKKKRL